MANVWIPAVSRDLVASMPSAVSRDTGSSVFVLKTSLATLRSNVFVSPAPATPPQTVHSLCSAAMESVCLLVLLMKAVLSMKDVSKDFACVS